MRHEVSSHAAKCRGVNLTGLRPGPFMPVSLRAAQIRHATHSDKRNLVVVADLRNSGGLHVGADGALERLAGVLYVVGGYEGVTRQHLAAAHLPHALSLLTHRLQCGERMLQSILPLIRLTVVAFGMPGT